MCEPHNLMSAYDPFKVPDPVIPSSSPATLSLHQTSGGSSFFTSTLTHPQSCNYPHPLAPHLRCGIAGLRLRPRLPLPLPCLSLCLPFLHYREGEAVVRGLWQPGSELVQMGRKRIGPGRFVVVVGYWWVGTCWAVTVGLLGVMAVGLCTKFMEGVVGFEGRQWTEGGSCGGVVKEDRGCWVLRWRWGPKSKN
ncbi:hypothetical protein RIF29_25242 [Crotalaria pallida]|uniref:Uncharacterized protein n=1 Tax=Crotalaria pallida TaxID=3830 RepID=A0AAN9I0X2_CROPI